MTNFNQSLFDQATRSRDTRQQLKAGEACLYHNQANYRFSISTTDAQELAQYKYLNVERNTYTGEIYLVFNHETGWPVFGTKAQNNVVSGQRSLYNALADNLGVGKDYEGHTLCHIKRTLLENVYIIKK